MSLRHKIAFMPVFLKKIMLVLFTYVFILEYLIILLYFKETIHFWYHFYDLNFNNSRFTLRFNYKNNNIKSICWIFNEKSIYQVLISFCSIIKSNSGVNFNYYFIIPPNSSINVSIFEHFLPYGSKIIIRRYKPIHAFMSVYPRLYERRTCKWPPIVLVKFWLYEILPEVEKVLYLDTDIVNAAPISPLWKTSLKGRTLGGTKRLHLKIEWINSGVIFYNLANLALRSRNLWNCADKWECFIDDYWHTKCHNKIRITIPYRYNVEFQAMKIVNKSSYQINEEKNAVFYHLKDLSKEFYTIINRSKIKKMKIVKGSKEIYDILHELYYIREWVDSEIKMG